MLRDATAVHTVNGATQSFTYNAANQRTDFAYDAAGNLTGYGYTDVYTYDALGRMTRNDGDTLVYNGDGVLVQAGNTVYTQDLAAPLSQVLADGAGTYVYGLSRLASLTATERTWELPDALGSVRMSLDDAGDPLHAAGNSYSPFGTVASGAVPEPFGFTGEELPHAVRVGVALGQGPGAGIGGPTCPYLSAVQRPRQSPPASYHASGCRSGQPPG